MAHNQLPIPPHFDGDKVRQVWRVPYQERAADAEKWRRKHNIPFSYEDTFRLALIAVDIQNTFSLPEFELYVAGRSGTGAIDDNRRLCEFIYRNLNVITEIFPTMDTHNPLQIFHSIFLVNDKGEHPAPMTTITQKDIEQGKWKLNPATARSLGIDPDYGQRHLLRYTEALKKVGKYDWIIWPYHAMLGGIGHALVAAVEEAIFFHSIVRNSQPNFQIKGNNPLTEHYSVLGPEVLDGPDGRPIANKNGALVEKLLQFDAVVIAGQAKSHCVAWTIDDLLEDVFVREKGLTEKVYLLEDCTSPVVIPDVVDFTEQADAAFKKFANAGMHVVRSTDPMAGWPGMDL